MFAIGATQGVPFTLLSTVMVMDLGTQIKSRGSVTKISSLIEGIGSVGTAIQVIIVPYISFDYLFYFFSSGMLISSVVLLPLFIRDVKEIESEASKQMTLSE